MLQEIINTPFEIQLGENKVKVKRASLKDFAMLQEYSRVAKDDPDVIIKQMAYAIRLCILKAIDNEEDKSKITDDYVMELIPLSEVRNSQNILTQLGFMLPTETKIGEVKK
jgi:hypothetical protein